MPKQNPTSPKTVLGKVKAVLDTFALEQPKLTLTEIVNKSGLSKPTVFRLLQELTEMGFVTQNGKFYQPGVAFFRLGMIAKQQLNLDAVLNGLLMPIADATGETVITAILDKGQIFYIHTIESRSPLRFVAGEGTRRDVPFGATGMALLSQLTLDEQKAILTPPFKAFTSKTLTTTEAYLKRLEETKTNQMVIEVGEYYEGIMAIAVPVIAQKPLTFTVVGPEERVRPNQRLIIRNLQHAAAEFNKLDIEIPL